MVEVEHRAALLMPHRRQLVHPLSVVAFVVRRLLDECPSMLVQRGLRPRQIGRRHQDVDVCDDASDGTREAGSGIAGALEEHWPDINGQQCTVDAVNLPADQPLELVPANASRREPVSRPVGKTVGQPQLLDIGSHPSTQLGLFSGWQQMRPSRPVSTLPGPRDCARPSEAAEGRVAHEPCECSPRRLGDESINGLDSVLEARVPAASRRARDLRSTTRRSNPTRPCRL